MLSRQNYCPAWTCTPKRSKVRYPDSPTARCCFLIIIIIIIITPPQVIQKRRHSQFLCLQHTLLCPLVVISSLGNLKEKFTQKKNWKFTRHLLLTLVMTGWRFVVHKTFLELHSKTASQHWTVKEEETSVCLSVCLSVLHISAETFIRSSSHLAGLLLRAQGSFELVQFGNTCIHKERKADETWLQHSASRLYYLKDFLKS